MTKTDPTGRSLDQASLRQLALDYAARFATSTGKLRRYLDRKLRERGWDDSVGPDMDAVIERLVALGYVDDKAFGEMRSRALLARGLGAQRVRQDLSWAGLSCEQVTEIAADIEPDAAAEAFARRRRFGRWDLGPSDPARQRRQYAAMLRAGHAPAAIRKALQSGGSIEPEDFPSDV